MKYQQMNSCSSQTMVDGKDITDKCLDEFLTTLQPEAKDWKAVEFRCMIQDILGNEVYCKHNSDKLGDRTIFYCITIPGENIWVRSGPNGDKNEFMTNSNQVTKPDETQVDSSNGSQTDRQRILRLSSYLVNWSYPIPSDGKNKSCLIKVYDIKLVEYLRVNDIVHVSGLVEPAEFEDDSQLMTNKNSPNGTTESHQPENFEQTTILGSTDFEPASDFPHRLVPRVHVRKLKKLKHINPLLPDIISRDIIDVTKVKLARARMSTIFTQLLGGDSLAAEYLILSLISKIHRRKPTTGHFSIGLSGFRPDMKFLIEKLYDIISKITTHSHYIDMSIANLNNLRFTPTKDTENNKMIAGTLQLPDEMYLLLNETALSEGLLNAQGSQNLGTLSQIIRWQQHNYNFQFHSVKIDTDLKILVISEGKPILPVPYRVHLDNINDETVQSMRHSCENVDSFLTDELLTMFRYYITALADVPEFDIPEDMVKTTQEYFANRRAKDGSNNQPLFSADDLSSYLTIARYLTISRGELNMTNDVWDDTCRMESTRSSRLTASRS